jgi:1-deoxy-D-xylulose-5-phosphate reductoisomerase
LTKGLSILGSTGSIGTSTLDVVRAHPGRFGVKSLSAGSNIALLKDQIREFQPAFVSVEGEDAAREIAREFAISTGFGPDGASEAASMDGVDLVVSAISGAAGLLPTLSAVRAGKFIALANKETLVMAGNVVMAEAEKSGSIIMPVDSEHSAIFQSLAGHRKSDVRSIILTASGGPFLSASAERLKTVTPEEALRHPNWSMGRKITIDSATLMNKGLEVIEAKWLFDVPLSSIVVAIHPQSIVHSMVEYVDGSVVAQLGVPDMKGPIAYALAYPERIETGAERLDLMGAKFEFMAPDTERFPCLKLAYSAMEAGGTMPVVLNASDEVAVEAFLSGRIGFTGISAVISAVMDEHEVVNAQSLDEILAADGWARRAAESCMNGPKRIIV